MTITSVLISWYRSLALYTWGRALPSCHAPQFCITSHSSATFKSQLIKLSLCPHSHCYHGDISSPCGLSWSLLSPPSANLPFDTSIQHPTNIVPMSFMDHITHNEFMPHVWIKDKSFWSGAHHHFINKVYTNFLFTLLTSARLWPI
jgi:hypothetical protein